MGCSQSCYLRYEPYAGPRTASPVAPPTLKYDVSPAEWTAKLIPWEKLNVEQVVASGAFGRVSKGKYNFTDVAIKQLKNAGELSELMDEVETMRSLMHPNIISTMGLAIDGDEKIAVVMEFLPATLYSLLHNEPYRRAYAKELTWGRCFLAVITDVCDGMDYLHYVGFTHRDLKPANVLLSEAWLAKIADFGETDKDPGRGSRVAEDSSFKNAGSFSKDSFRAGDDSTGEFTIKSESFKKKGNANAVSFWGLNFFSSTIGGNGPMTHAGPLTNGAGATIAKATDRRVRGTAPYLSPEAASAGTEAAVETGPPADVWGFGCVLAHIAARQPPYVDVFKTGSEVVFALRDGSAKPLTQIKPKNMPDALRAVAERCCQWQPSARPTFKELGGMLRSFEMVSSVCGSLAVSAPSTADGPPPSVGRVGKSPLHTPFVLLCRSVNRKLAVRTCTVRLVGLMMKSALE